jgi:hypothetical protein
LFGHGTVAVAAAAGPVLSYATFLGGSPTAFRTTVAATTADSQGNVYITGTTDGGFPTTAGSYHPQFIGGLCPVGVGNAPPCTDAFVAKFGPTGSLIWSTYVGGTNSDAGGAIAVDETGNVYVAGATSSTDFPITPDALQKTGPGGFLIKLDAAGAHLLYGTYFGNTEDGANALAYSAAGDLYVAGSTDSGAIPLLNALQLNSGGGYDAFIMHWRASDMTLLASTLLGGSGDDNAFALAVDQSANLYITGETNSANFPLKSPLQSALGGAVCAATVVGQVSACWTAFVTKLNGDLSSILYSTYLGGDGGDIGRGIAVDAQGYIIVAGSTGSSDFPIVNAFQPHLGADGDGFIAKLTPDGASWFIPAT